MESNITLEVSGSIAASKAVVWNALIDPVLIKKYMFGTDAASDWKVGSAITFSGVWEGKAYVDKGTILQIEKEKILKYNYWSSFSGTEDLPANYATIIYSLTEKDGQTIFTIFQDGIKTKETRDHSEQNWKMIINTIKDLLEK